MTEEVPLTDPKVSALEAKVVQLEKQASDYKLLIADFENSRKRLAQDNERQRKFAAEPVVRDLLSVIDNLERATDAAKQSGETGVLSQGVNATIGMFVDVLRRHGVSRVDVGPGSTFDPNVHQAVSEMPTNDHPAGSVAVVLQGGFMFHDRVLRPASVIVAVEPPAGG